MRLALFCLILVAVYFANQQRKFHSYTLSTDRTDDALSDFPELRGESIKVLAQRLELSPCVYGRREGIEGRPTIVYAAFERLNQLVSDSFWFTSIYNSSAVMRVYAYNALRKRNSSLAKQAREFLKDDTSVVCFISYDTPMSYSVGNYVSIAKQ